MTSRCARHHRLLRGSAENASFSPSSVFFVIFSFPSSLLLLLDARPSLSSPRFVYGIIFNTCIQKKKPSGWNARLALYARTCISFRADSWSFGYVDEYSTRNSYHPARVRSFVIRPRSKQEARHTLRVLYGRGHSCSNRSSYSIVQYRYARTSTVLQM